jgi:hypothetical protein
MLSLRRQSTPFAGCVPSSFPSAKSDSEVPEVLSLVFLSKLIGRKDLDDTAVDPTGTSGSRVHQRLEVPEMLSLVLPAMLIDRKHFEETPADCSGSSSKDCQELYECPNDAGPTSVLTLPRFIFALISPIEVFIHLLWFIATNLWVGIQARCLHKRPRDVSRTGLNRRESCPPRRRQTRQSPQNFCARRISTSSAILTDYYHPGNTGELYRQMYVSTQLPKVTMSLM